MPLMSASNIGEVCRCLSFLCPILRADVLGHGGNVKSLISFSLLSRYVCNSSFLFSFPTLTLPALQQVAIRRSPRHGHLQYSPAIFTSETCWPRGLDRMSLNLGRLGRTCNGMPGLSHKERQTQRRDGTAALPLLPRTTEAKGKEKKKGSRYGGKKCFVGS